MPSVQPAPGPSPSQGADGSGDDASLITRVGTAFGAGAVASALVAIPAAMRIAASEAAPCGALVVWGALVAAALGPMIGAIAILRNTRVGLRSFGGPGRESFALSVLLWAAALFLALTSLGALLRATTHHHGLAGATFGITGLVIALVLALIVARFSSIVRMATPNAGGLALAGVSLVLALTMMLLARRAAEAPAAADGDPSSASAMAVDVLAFAIVASLGSREPFARSRALARLGPPVAATLLVLGISALRSCPELTEAVLAHAPAFIPVIQLLSPH